ncbi:DUF6541 family protein [Blastococcus sp. TF02A-30]|uniref:DUF6541 family protein n=1 Tax=Blastococcus sp. TF02A-30 TaxID=2250580 RepID=UPI001314F245|nr:DUF6541 family protein [Blastococcus sp. TF02A-30]
MSSAPVIAAALALLLVPGFVLGLALGLRGWVLVGSSPALTVGAAGVLAAWYGMTGIAWTTTSTLVGLLVLCAVAVACARPWRGHASPCAIRYGLHHHVAIGAALAGTAVVGALAVQRGTQNLEGIPQYWDAMFHANAVRYIAETQDAAPSALAAVAQPANPDYYYPHTYHSLGALLFDSGVEPVQTVLNSLSACLPAVFALSLVALLRVVAPRPAMVFAGALLAGMFSAFPYDLVNFGPLLPLALAIAVLPAACGLLVRLVRSPSVGVAGALAVAAVGLLTTHPSAAVAAALLMALLLLTGRRTDRPWRDRRTLLAVVLTAAAAVVLASPGLRGLTGVAGNATEIDWPATETPGGAVGRLLLFNHETLWPQWWLALLLLLGAVAALRSPALRPFLVGAGVFLALFVLAASYDTAVSLRLTSVWWNDRWRLAALFVVPAAVLAAAGFVRLEDWVLRLLDRLPGRPPPAALVARGSVVVGLLAVLLVLLTPNGYLERNTRQVSLPYRDGPTVSSGEEAAYAELARLWDGGTVLNDPADGSPWAYALEGLPLVFKTPLTQPSSPEQFGSDRITLIEDFAPERDSAAVEDALESLDVRWVIVGEGFATDTVSRAPGLEGLDAVPGLTEVWSNDAATIYRVERGTS